MFRFHGPRWAVLIPLGVAAAASAQQPGAPAAAASAARDLSYRSVLEGYQPFADQKPGSWRDANDNVGRIGGWRAYANEVQGAGAVAPQPAASGPAGSAAPAAAPAPHPGHGKH
jgi:hypothetical protein